MPNILDQLECNNELEKASNYIRHRRRLRTQEFSGLHQHTYSGTRSHKCRNPPNDPLCSYALDKDEVDNPTNAVKFVATIFRRQYLCF